MASIFRKIRNRIFHLINKYLYLPLCAVKKLIIRFFPYALIPFEYFLLLVASLFVTIRVGELESRAIGHFSLPVEIYLSERDCDLSKHGYKFLDIFFFNELICNIFLAKKWRSIFYIGSRYFLEPFYLTIQAIHPKSRFLVPYRHWRNHSTWQLSDISECLSRTRPHLEFSADERAEGDKALKKFGIEPTDRIVCFHARDPNFREGPTATSGFRDSTIQTQINAMVSTVDYGYKAVRVGRNMREHVETTTSNVIDYSQSVLTNDFLDIYLCFRCSFFVCTGSGLEAVALVFRKPLVCVNISQWGLLDLHDTHQYPLFIPKKQIWADSKQELTLSEIQKIGSHYFTSNDQYNSQGILLVENTAEDIRDVVVEMHLRISGLWHECEASLKRQECFRKRLTERNGRTIPMQIGSAYLQKNPYLLH